MIRSPHRAVCTWLAGRNPRERVLVVATATLAAAWLAWLGVIAPWQRAHAQLEARVQARTATLARLEAAAPRLGAPSAGTPPAVSGARLASHVEQTLAEAGLGGDGARIEPVSGGEVQLSVARAGFDAVLAWLETQARAGVTVSPLELRAGQAAGGVSLRARLRACTPAPSAPSAP